ncbi:uncharacterized protein F54H12.2 [Trichonephila clavipes]|nr:uncharacterized protein F54H12.2 [Trichonephila clavipes]
MIGRGKKHQSSSYPNCNRKGQWVQFHPITNVADGGPIEFLIPGSGDAYLDLSQTQLHVRAKIFKSDVDVCLNERTVSSSNNTYPYRAIIETLLNHGYDSKTSQLTSELYYKDTAGRMNVYDENDKEPNEGFKSRVKFIKGSGTVDMVGRLHVDLFNQDRLLLNLVDVKLKLIRSKPSFCLMGERDYNVIFEHVSLYVRKVQLNLAVVIGHAKALERTTAKYPIDRVSCKISKISSKEAPRDFLGVYPSDKIPKVKKKAALVVNTDPHDEEGSHWLAMYIQDEKTIEFLTLMDFHHRYTSLISRNM